MQGLHKEGEYRQLEFWTQEKHVRDTYSAQLQWSWNFTEIIFGINKKYWSEELTEGATLVGTRHQGVPGSPGRALVGCAHLVGLPR